MDPIQLDYATYIVTTPERLWQALTSAEDTQKYFFGRRVQSSWQVGAPWQLLMPDGSVDSQGVVLEADPPRTLATTWHVEWLEEYRHLAEAEVRYRIEPLGGVVRLTVSELHKPPIEEKYLEGGRKGWPVILCGLKTLLETGRTMPLPEMPS